MSFRSSLEPMTTNRALKTKSLGNTCYIYFFARCKNIDHDFIAYFALIFGRNLDFTDMAAWFDGGFFKLTGIWFVDKFRAVWFVGSA